MEYRDLCQKILESNPSIRDVFVVNSEAGLVAFNRTKDTTRISEARLAEVMEDLLFMVGCRKHCEDLFGSLQYLHIKHEKTETFALPFDTDKLLCICLKTNEIDEKEFLDKLKHIQQLRVFVK
jgi:hypothetical protein